METIQAQKLLEIAEAAGKIANVKTCLDGKGRAYPGYGILLGLSGKNKAIIKPFGHRKEEVVPLDSIGFWKKGCDFDIGEAMSAIKEAKPTGLPVIPVPQLSYVVFSEKMKGVWSENRSWITNIDLASRYSEYAHAARAVGKLNKAPLQDDARAMLKEDAACALMELLTRPNTSQPIPTAIPSSVLAATKIIPKKSSSILDDDDLIDASVLFNENETALRQAEGERRLAADEYASAKKTLKEIIQKLRDLDSRVVELGGQSTLKDSHSEKKPRAKRLFLRKPIQDILKAHSCLDDRGIFARLQASCPGVSVKQVRQSIYGMKADSYIYRNGGGWSLTTEGKNAQMKG